MIVTYLILALLGIIWVSVSVMSSEFYSTGKENRFRFRYWFSIGMLNIFHIILAFFYKMTGDAGFQEARWLAFVLVDALLLEIFVIPIAKRKCELFVRTAFYFCLILDFMGNTPVFMVVNSIILIYLASNMKYDKPKKHFKISFVLYGLMSTLPYFVGFTTNLSLLSGLVYSAHLGWGVRMLYKEEKADEFLRKRLGGINE